MTNRNSPHACATAFMAWCIAHGKTASMDRLVQYVDFTLQSDPNQPLPPVESVWREVSNVNLDAVRQALGLEPPALTG